MAVSELLRGIGGALAGFLAVTLLALSLAETRELGAFRLRGINWVAPRSHAVHFAPVWHPVFLCGLPTVICGYLMGTRLTSRRATQFACIGMAAGMAIMLILPSPLAEKYGEAGRNSFRLLLVVGVFMGGCAGALFEERWYHRPRGRWD